MKFGEKVKELRTQKGFSQAELAKMIGVSVRTIASYEGCSSYPRYQELYDKLAQALDTQVDYLRTENDSFITQAAAEYGRRGQLQAQEILEQTARLFAGGTLSEEDEYAFTMDMQKIFWDSKQRAKKFTPKKHLSQDNEQD